MKLMNKETYIESLNEMIKEISIGVNDFSISYKTDDSREEKNGSIFFIFTVKNKKNPKSKEYKIALYIFENRKSITSFIVNGRTLNLLFENSTINSPDVAVHYLKDILLGEVKWIKDIEESIRKQKKTEPRKSSSNRNHNTRSNNKPGVKNKVYNKNGNGGRNRGYNHKSSSSIQIRTSKTPYENSNRFGGTK